MAHVGTSRISYTLSKDRFLMHFAERSQRLSGCHQPRDVPRSFPSEVQRYLKSINQVIQTIRSSPPYFKAGKKVDEDNKHTYKVRETSPLFSSCACKGCLATLRYSMFYRDILSALQLTDQSERKVSGGKSPLYARLLLLPVSDSTYALGTFR